MNDKVIKMLREALKLLEEEKKEPFVLKLKVTLFNHLFIYYNDERGIDKDIGFITDKGYVNILNNETYVENYKKWVDNGMKTSEREIEWRNKKYYIQDFVLRSNIENGGIYDFNICAPEMNCHDENIVRFKYNLTPIIW